MSESATKSSGKRNFSQISSEENSFKKVINDPIHGHIEIPELCVRIMDTPQYQRLRHIKQLGAAYYVYPGAAHNRFEHGIGVCYLAGKFVRQLQKNDSKNKFGITENDIRCVEIAGLCHDLGHGPFSHVFERHFIHVLDKTKKGQKWSHETASLMMFSHLFKKNNSVKDAFEKFKITQKDRKFIKQLIRGLKKDKLKPTEIDQIHHRTGREEDKDFLYEIVANDMNGIDVDKFDYYARDCYYLGYKNSFSHERLMKFARVIEVTEDDGTRRRHICFPDKEVENIYDLFYQRTLLHHRTCQHKTTKVIELMHMEALREANDKLKINGKGHHFLKISKTIWDPDAYTNLTDSVFERILRPTDQTAYSDENLRKARALLVRVDNREHYTFVGEARPKYRQAEIQETFAGEAKLAELIAQQLDNNQLTNEDIVVNVVDFNYGKKYRNPVDSVYFYNKSDMTTAKKLPKDQVSEMLPSVFFEQHIRVYSKEKDKSELVKEAFRKWCKSYELVIIKDFGEPQSKK